MNIVYVSCNVSIKESIKDLLDNLKINSYQIIEQVPAKSPVDNPRFNTPVWPGYNCIFYVQISVDETADLITQLKNHNKNAINKSELITVCSWKLQDCFFD